ncbi:hypothetical protein Q5P01_015217 [Channa striata]|uniref:Uncharacterized protein n=1 Tax=Channa striata TaxID=64152 RepID=A0AA88MIR3_CHASR|nr:hypothetical protein Q5P01_015217 [Channa striata]
MRNTSVRRELVLCPNLGRAAVSPARQKKLEHWAEQQSCSPVLLHSSHRRAEPSQHQSKLSCFNLLARSCEDPARLTEPTVSFKLNLCPSGQTGSVRAAVGFGSAERATSACPHNPAVFEAGSGASARPGTRQGNTAVLRLIAPEKHISYWTAVGFYNLRRQVPAGSQRVSQVSKDTE